MDGPNSSSSMTDGRVVEVLHAKAEAIGAIGAEPLGGATAAAKRYLHADVTLRHNGRRRFRLKVVNPWRDDSDDIRRCCANANSVHMGLCSLDFDLGFGVPRVHLLEEHLRSDVYVVELIAAKGTKTDSAAQREAIVDRLLKLEEATRGWDESPGRKPEWIQSCPRAGYREHVEVSLRGVANLAEGERRALMKESLRAFDRLWHAGALEAGRCLAHGDFSGGNLLESSAGFTLIDFEHSHVGAPGLDAAHLYVNLLFDGREDEALDLKERYLSTRSARGLGSAPGAFRALLIERIAGKWNAMKTPTRESYARIRALLDREINRP